jgi:leucyl-tRNA synthetase
MDKCFDNELDYYIAASFKEFDRMCFRDGLHKCWFDLLIARDMYRDWSKLTGLGMHETIIARFARAITVMMAPITPHWSEALYEHMKLPADEGEKAATVCDASWPKHKDFDRLLRKQYLFLRDTVKNLRQIMLKEKKLAKGQPVAAYVYLANSYDPIKIQVLQWLASVFQDDGTFPDDFNKQLKLWCDGDAALKPQTKTIMQFAAFMKADALDRGADALATELPYSQREILDNHSVYITKSMNLSDVSFHDVNDGADLPGDKKKWSNAVPGKPSAHFYNPK